MKRTLIILIGLLLIILIGLLMISTNLYAAGDLIVEGKLGVGTVSPAVKLDVMGDMRLLSPDQGIYSLIFERTDEDSLQHSWKIWHMNQSYSKNALEIYEYKTGTDGVACSSTQGGFCKLRLSLSEGGNLGIGESRPGANNRLYVTSDYTNTNWGKAGYFYNTARVTSSGVYKNYGLIAGINPIVTSQETNTGYAIALEANPLYTSTEDGTLQVQAGVKAFYGNYDGCGGSCGVGKIINAYGVLVAPRHDNGEITNSYGVYIGNPVTGGIVTHNWGIYQASPDMNNYFAGAVGIAGAIDPSYILTVNGIMNATSYGPSDQNLKDDIKTIESPLKKVMDIEGVSFNWKKTEEYKDRNFPEGRHYGVIAQEVEKVLPDIVMDGANGEKSVNYSELIPVLIEAMKEQQGEIERLKAEIERLKPQKVAAR